MPSNWVVHSRQMTRRHSTQVASAVGSGWLWLLFFLMIRRPPRSTLFPYTTLFQSAGRVPHHRGPLRQLADHLGRVVCHLLQCLLGRSEEHTSELQSLTNLVCRL